MELFELLCAFVLDLKYDKCKPFIYFNLYAPIRITYIIQIFTLKSLTLASLKRLARCAISVPISVENLNRYNKTSFFRGRGDLLLFIIHSTSKLLIQNHKLIPFLQVLKSTRMYCLFRTLEEKRPQPNIYKTSLENKYCATIVCLITLILYLLV